MTNTSPSLSTGRIALVTGGSRGLGRDMALQLARGGHDLIITYRAKQVEAAAVCAEITALGRRAIALPLEVGSTAGFPAFAKTVAAALTQHWGRTTFDALVNNAGIGSKAPFATTSEAQFDELMNVHLKGVFLLTQTLLPQLAENGRIVCISTGLTRFTSPGYAAYATMKGGIEVLVKYLAKELGPRRITVNVVAPGAIETDFTKDGFDSHPEVRGFLAANTALGRIGQPTDIGGVVAFLCSPAGAWVTAQRLEASGGMFV